MNNKSNTKQALWVGLGYLGTFLVALGSAMVLSRYLSKEEYGTYRQIIYLYTMLQGVFAAGLPAAYSYFLPNMTLSQGKTFSKILLMFFVVSGILMTMLFYCGAALFSSFLHNDLLLSNLRLFSPIPLLLIPTLGIEGLFTAIRKTEQLLIYNVVTKFFMFFSLVLPVVIWEASVQKVIYGWLISALFSFSMALFFKNKPFSKVSYDNLPFKLIEIFKYTIPIMLTSYLTVLQKSADQFFISRYYGESVFAEYSNGFFEIPFVGMIVGSVSAVMIPIFSGAASGKIKLQNAIVSWRNALEKCIYLVYPLLCFCFVVAGQVIILIYGNKYEASILYFKLALSLNFFCIVLINPIIVALGKTKFYLCYNVICTVLIWSTKYLTVQIWDTPYAVAVVSVINSIILIVVPYIYINRLLNIRLISMNIFFCIVKIIIYSLVSGFWASYFIDMMVPSNNLIFSLCMKGVLFTILYFGIVFVTKEIKYYTFLKSIF
ncbi:oligosaccharide flippase family protein [Bacteroides nordii]|uniref:oligosaccharide flippase family protein n=1 Tax=Bacteroides nordii TaxID=291645 RepID=UPI0022E8209C|nr:oligosaccharide flippase family protein [Bacteroides nordii]